MIPNQITIHHSASSFDTTLPQINAWHQARDFTYSSLGYYIGYHYVIEANGTITQTRRDNEMGCHSIPNTGKIGVCLVGNFMNSEPRDAQLESLEKLLNSLKKLYNIEKVLGHRDCNTTECPGGNLYKYTTLFTKINWLQRLIYKLMGAKTNV